MTDERIETFEETFIRLQPVALREELERLEKAGEILPGQLYRERYLVTDYVPGCQVKACLDFLQGPPVPPGFIRHGPRRPYPLIEPPHAFGYPEPEWDGIPISAATRPTEPPKEPRRTNYQPQQPEPKKPQQGPQETPQKPPQQQARPAPRPPIPEPKRAEPEPIREAATLPGLPARQDQRPQPPRSEPEEPKSKGGRPTLFSNPEYLAASPIKKKRMQSAYYAGLAPDIIKRLTPDVAGAFLNNDGAPYSVSIMEQIGRASENVTPERCENIIRRAAREIKRGKTVKEVERIIRNSRTYRRNS